MQVRISSHGQEERYLSGGPGIITFRAQPLAPVQTLRECQGGRESVRLRHVPLVYQLWRVRKCPQCGAPEYLQREVEGSLAINVWHCKNGHLSYGTLNSWDEPK